MDDLGAQGQPPTHPELLDWLALEFRNNGWDVKALVKTLLTSDTYQQTSTPRPDLKAADPYNRLYGRQSRWRLDAEMVRDTALSVAGILAAPQGGDSVKPYQPTGYWAQLNFPKRQWTADQGAKLYRRTLYTYWCRSFLHPSLIAFDAPSREECVVQRGRSNIPQQGLVLLNDPIFVEAARVFGERIARDGGPDPIRWAVREALARPVHDTERDILQRVYDVHHDRYTKDAESARAFVANGQWPAPDDIDPAALASWGAVARTILNLYETTSRF